MGYRINHIHLKSQDPRKTAEWYVNAFDFQIASDETRVFGDRFVRCRSADGGINVNISGARTNEKPGSGNALPRQDRACELPHDLDKRLTAGSSPSPYVRQRRDDVSRREIVQHGDGVVGVASHDRVPHAAGKDDASATIANALGAGQRDISERERADPVQVRIDEPLVRFDADDFAGDAESRLDFRNETPLISLRRFRGDVRQRLHGLRRDVAILDRPVRHADDRRGIHAAAELGKDGAVRTESATDGFGEDSAKVLFVFSISLITNARFGTEPPIALNHEAIVADTNELPCWNLPNSSSFSMRCRKSCSVSMTTRTGRVCWPLKRFCSASYSSV